MANLQPIKGKKGTTYRVSFMRGGSRFSKNFKKKSDAELFRASVIANSSLADSLTCPILNNLKFSAAKEEFLSSYTGKDRSIGQRLEFWNLLFKGKPVGKVTRTDVKAGLKQLSKTKSPATVNRYKSALGSLQGGIALC